VEASDEGRLQQRKSGRPLAFDESRRLFWALLSLAALVGLVACGAADETVALSIPPEPHDLERSSITVTTQVPPSALVGDTLPPEVEPELSYYWNAWAEPGEMALSGGSPALALEPHATYTVTVDLSVVEYDEPGIVTVRVARKFGNLMETAAKKPRPSRFEFTPVLLLDPEYFDTESRVLEPVNVDLLIVRELLAYEGESHDPTTAGDSRLARIERFEITTRGELGFAAIGLSIWQGDRPVDELSFPFCIAEGGDTSVCDQSSVARSGLGGNVMFDSAANIIASQNPPDAALHIFELSPFQVMGVFYRRDQGAYHVWKIEDNVAAFRQKLRQRQDAFGRVKDDPEGVGGDLANNLFPTNKGAIDALAAFKNFLEEYKQAEPFFGEDRPTIFVRYLSSATSPLLYPLGLANPDADPNGFVGYHVRIETPLPLQEYTSGEQCIVGWIPVMPPLSNDPALRAAHDQIRDRFSVNAWSRKTMFRISPAVDPVPVYTDIKPWHRWIGQDDVMPSTILAVLSHHNENALYFDPGAGEVSPDSVRRSFPQPSAAILAGCSTGAPGASELVRKLNGQGIDSVIATNTGISGELAGDFVNCFLQQFEKHTIDLPIGQAFADTQRCLYEIPTRGGNTSRYRSQVLSFSFAGNPHLRLCAAGAAP
jgi:hypothetical protein